MKPIDLTLLTKGHSIKVQRYRGSSLSNYSDRLYDIDVKLSQPDDSKSYTVTLLTDNIYQTYCTSWVHNEVTLDEFTLAALVEALSLVKYGIDILLDNNSASVKYTALSMLNNMYEVKNVISLILLRSTIIYQVGLEYPEFVPYLQLSYCSNKIAMSNGNLFPTKLDDLSLDKLIDDVLSIAIYGVIPKDANDQVVNFSLPLIYCSRRKGAVDAIISSDYIVNMFLNNKRCGQVNSSPIDEYDIGNISRNSDSIVDGDNMFDNIQISVDDIVSLRDGGGSRPSDMILSLEKGVNKEFFDYVGIAYASVINNLHYIFKKAFNTIKPIAFKDGEINVSRQQEAYVNSIIGEEGNDYLISKMRKIDIDIAIVRDISGSTDLTSKSYAEMVVILLMALDRIQGVRTCVIDFEGQAYLRKRFSDSLKYGSIFPTAHGGTHLSPALEILNEQQFKGKKNLLIILSDGEINDETYSNELLEKMTKQYNLSVLKYGFNGFQKRGFECVTIDQIPSILSRDIIKNGIEVIR